MGQVEEIVVGDGGDLGELAEALRVVDGHHVAVHLQLETEVNDFRVVLPRWE